MESLVLDMMNCLKKIHKQIIINKSTKNMRCVQYVYIIFSPSWYNLSIYTCIHNVILHTYIMLVHIWIIFLQQFFRDVETASGISNLDISNIGLIADTVYVEVRTYVLYL